MTQYALDTGKLMDLLGEVQKEFGAIADLAHKNEDPGRYAAAKVVIERAEDLNVSLAAWIGESV
jgi:hypothetical protein